LPLPAPFPQSIAERSDGNLDRLRNIRVRPLLFKQAACQGDIGFRKLNSFECHSERTAPCAAYV
jgi:hypothetical protein